MLIFTKIVIQYLLIKRNDKEFFPLLLAYRTWYKSNIVERNKKFDFEWTALISSLWTKGLKLKIQEFTKTSTRYSYL